MRSTKSTAPAASATTSTEQPWEIGPDGKLALTPAQVARMRRENEEFVKELDADLAKANFAGHDTP